MPYTPADLAEIAAINLHFAQAEVYLLEDRGSIARALEHIRLAEHALSILLAEYEDAAA